MASGSINWLEKESVKAKELLNQVLSVSFYQIPRKTLAFEAGGIRGLHGVQSDFCFFLKRSLNLETETI